MRVAEEPLAPCRAFEAAVSSHWPALLHGRGMVSRRHSFPSVHPPHASAAFELASAAPHTMPPCPCRTTDPALVMYLIRYMTLHASHATCTARLPRLVLCAFFFSPRSRPPLLPDSFACSSLQQALISVPPFILVALGLFAHDPQPVSVRQRGRGRGNGTGRRRPAYTPVVPLTPGLPACPIALPGWIPAI